MATKTANRPHDFEHHVHYDEDEAYDLKNSGILKSLCKGIGQGRSRFDSIEMASIFFARELDYVKTETYDVQYPDLNAMKLFPVSSEAGEASQTVTYYTYDKTGVAKIIEDYSTDLPRADVQGKPTTVPVRGLGDSYGYSVDEMRASAAVPGKNLDTRKGESARYAIERLINEIAWKGDDAYGLLGILSKEQNIPLYVLPEGESGYTQWMKKTADEILADVNGMVASVSYLTKNVEKPDTLLLPDNVFIYISSLRLQHTEYLTVLEAIKRSTPYIKEIIGVPELNDNTTETNPYASDEVDENGDSKGQGVALLYTRNKKKLSLEIPMMFLQHPLQIRNLETIIPCEAKVAGVIVYYPMSAMIAVGV